MPQVTLYVDDETAAAMRRGARASGMSLSRWVALAIRKGARSEWPDSVRGLAGAWKDFPPARALRGRGGRDVRRRAL